MGKGLNELDSQFLQLATRLLKDATDAGLEPVVEDTGRTQAEQQNKLAIGVSWTKRSKHLPQPPEGKSKAIDIVPKMCLAMKYWGWNGTVDNSHPAWRELIFLARKIRGIRCGVDFPHPDPGHFEFNEVVASGVEAEVT